MNEDIEFKLTEVSEKEKEQVKKTVRKPLKRKKKREKKLDETEQDYLWNIHGYKHVITEDGRLIKVFKPRDVMKKKEIK